MASKTSIRAISFCSGFRTQKRLILISFVRHLAFRGSHMRICYAKNCKTSRWTICPPTSQNLIIFLKFKVA